MPIAEVAKLPSINGHPLAQQPGQVHFRVAGLKAALERGLDALLGREVAYTIGEEIGIATEVFDRRERNCPKSRLLLFVVF
ncbi:MAG: hypothetical protein WBG13_30855 [Pseudolabrys sp.]